MALQGDLDSFPLPDVLALLAGTEKSGRLEVQAGGGHGELWLRRGELLGGSASNAPNADQPADVLYEVLRLGGGAFRFEEVQVGEEGSAVAVEDALGQAEALVQEWRAIESVVPSIWSGLALRSELSQPMTVSPEQWRVLVAVGPAGTSRGVADVLGLTDLAACGQVRDLVERGFLDVYEVEHPELEVAEADQAYEQPLDEGHVEQSGPAEGYYDAHDEVATLSAEGGPVVIETREDALLPEPLPGDSTEWHDEVAGSVDRHRYDLVEPIDFDGAGEPGIQAEWPAATPLAPAPPMAADPSPAPVPFAQPEAHAHPAGQGAWNTPARGLPRAADDDDIFVADAAPSGSPSDVPRSHQAPAIASPPPLPGPHQADRYSVEDDRDSLMRFLSTVKP